MNLEYVIDMLGLSAGTAADGAVLNNWGRGAIMAVEGLAMSKGERPDRGWKEYNEHLVQRGEILLAVESLQGWQEELVEMNRGKNGRPFRYPHSVMLFLGKLRVVFSLPYRKWRGWPEDSGG